jgi:hypothetical protein
MDRITARTPRSTRSVLAALAVFLGAATAVSLWFAFAEASSAPSGYSLALATALGLFCSAWLALSLWALIAATATYEADDLGLKRVGWRNTTAIAWNEIARYRVRTFGGDLTYVFHDRQGRRRTSIDFQLLGDDGEGLFHFMIGKLTAVLPGQDHQRAAQRYLRARQRARLPADPQGRRRALRVSSRGYLVLAVFFGLGGLFVGLSHGSDLLRDLRLLRHGRETDGCVLAVREQQSRVYYAFSSPTAGTRAGDAQIARGHLRRLRPGDRIVVCYLADEAQTHAPKVSLPRRSLYRPLFDSVIFLFGAAYLLNRRAWMLRELGNRTPSGTR